MLKLIRLIFSSHFSARLRGLIYSLIDKRNKNYKLVLYRPLRYSYRSIAFDQNGRATIFSNARIEGVKSYMGIAYTPLIILHNGVSIQQNSHITCAERIEIGSNTAIAANVTITDIDHPYEDVNTPIEDQPLIVSPVKIGKDCKIYNNAVILQGTTIGNHCVVGANSVVKGIFPDYSIIVGTPARIVKRYNAGTKSWERTNADGSFIVKEK